MHADMSGRGLVIIWAGNLANHIIYCSDVVWEAGQDNNLIELNNLIEFFHLKIIERLCKPWKSAV